MEKLTQGTLKRSAARFARELSQKPITELFGITDGKAIGTYIESAAYGIDFPELNVDLKVTSARQPQSSCPFRSAEQKVYGLGYHLLIFVYEKTDDSQLGSVTFLWMKLEEINWQINCFLSRVSWDIWSSQMHCNGELQYSRVISLANQETGIESVFNE